MIYLKMISKQKTLERELEFSIHMILIIIIIIIKDSADQVEHAAQHGQQQEGSLGTDIVDGANYCCTRSWHSKDEGPDGVQVKLRWQTCIK